MSKGKWSEEKKKAWSQKCKETKINNKNKSNEMLIECGNRLKKYWENNEWTEERRKRHSECMKKAVLNNPDSYTKNNVSGRTKIFECKDTQNNFTKVKGNWELQVANYLNENNIKWTNTIEPIKYFWEDKWHLYYPDFLLIDYDMLLEVKGYKTSRDESKWSSVKEKKFFTIEKKEINNLNKFFKKILIAGSPSGKALVS